MNPNKTFERSEFMYRRLLEAAAKTVQGFQKPMQLAKPYLFMFRQTATLRRTDLSISGLSLLVGLFIFPSAICDAQETSAAPETESESVAQEEHTNQLAGETSLYLLAHAHNPVNWYPWGEEALEKAKKENKLIFLSVGYSSCHWCHVMEDESFKDVEIAKLLNEQFVCIKVDREERPDVDMIYMAGLSAYNEYFGFRRNGGWPLSMFLTPEAKPFFGATYIPPHDGDRGVSAGFLSVCRNISRIWNSNPNQIKKGATDITNLTIRRLRTKVNGDGGELEKEWISGAIVDLHRRFDPIHGGFGYDDRNPMLPKFPRPAKLEFLLNQLEVRKDGKLKDQAKDILKVTLDKMMLGGIRDHLGGGFHRYSVDRFWHIPHFEKMLYDNAQLASLYAEASQAFDDEEYRRVARELVDFVLREMTSPEGGFYSALDADSVDAEGNNEEGAFYRWEKPELEKHLSAEQYQLAEKLYGLEGKPNFDEEYYALYLTLPLSQLTTQVSLDEAELRKQLKEIHHLLLEVRSKRNRPLTDDKILTSWNGLMIRGLADTGRVLDESKYVEAAIRAADFIWDNLRQDDGRLFRTHTKGVAKLNAYADDYAFLISGLLALHEATSDQKWLDRAEELQKKQTELFWDEDEGFYYTSDDHEQLLTRTKKTVDREIPSTNSVSVNNLIALADLTSNEEYRSQALKTAQSITGLLRQQPDAAAGMLIGVGRLLNN